MPALPTPPLAAPIVVDPRIPAQVPGFDAPFFQAGLAGYSDGAMRRVARDHGCPYAVSEALLDRVLLSGGRGKAREDPALGGADDGDHPLAGQIIGSQPEEMAAAALILVELGYDTIDVNLACPVKKIRKAHRGGHLLADPEHAIRILRAVRDAVPTRVPTTVKLRRGFDDTPEMAERFEVIFCAAYEAGYSWATVHGRTVVQKYVGPARWAFLRALVARHPDKLIFGSGDVMTARDVFAMLAETGVHAASIARGAIGNPWIFRQCRQRMAGESSAEPTVAEQKAVLTAHLRRSVAIHGDAMAARMMRKFGIMFARHHPREAEVKRAFIACRSLAEWLAVLEREYE